MTRASTPSRPPVLAIVYAVLAIVGAIGTWAYNIAFISSMPDIGYLDGWFANPASSSAAVDIIVVAIVVSIFMLVEGHRLGWSRWAWILVVLSFAIAVAFTFPLFLALRELALRRRAQATSTR
ncbi:DUF2834 domain-containing protein [Pseudoclavibacter chungangensis]|uniref:DUF2834 domain-containing protein n=1 Tax=Pseudoclavibacter chungangensis TaxID=587635 RepID=A0A7J5BP38_9MICO|nr:DUF2834 domain-containing protein [Pseudoclavibacter chungangensis]KAB1654304.1 DUF2834 domain-containing protein [Pseudoclavibacter chungangensis]NYJ65287.1 ABC-type multidrug transport system permease subunit [Pseudoclavibacter chungangensis]